MQGNRQWAPFGYFSGGPPCLSFSPARSKCFLHDLRGKWNCSAHLLESTSFFTARSSLSWRSKEITMATGPAVPFCVPTVINRESSSSRYGDFTSISPCNTEKRVAHLFVVVFHIRLFIWTCTVKKRHRILNVTPVSALSPQDLFPFQDVFLTQPFPCYCKALVLPYYMCKKCH